MQAADKQDEKGGPTAAVFMKVSVVGQELSQGEKRDDGPGRAEP